LKHTIRLVTALFALTAASFAGVSVTSPANGSVSNSPLHVAANATPISSAPVTAMQVYIDGALKYQVGGASVNTYITVGNGGHQVAVKAWDSAGKNFMTIVNVTASGSGITLSSPANAATVNGSVNVVGAAFSPYGIAEVQIYDNGKEVYNDANAAVNYTLSLTPGSHYIMVQAWDRTGTIFFHPVTVNSAGTAAASTAPTTTVAAASSSAPQASIPANAGRKLDIDQMGGWGWCNTCAGANGAGPADPYSMTQNINSPSIDGKAATFWLGGKIPYGSAIWWNQFGAVDSASHFVYDLQFYVSNPTIAQGLEFDVNQSVNGLKYILGTECDVRTNGGWRVWDTANAHWVATGASCSVRANAWNHLTWETERVGNQTHFIAVTLNGYRQAINKYFYAKPVSARELNVAFQMDGDEYEQAYQVWLDKVNFYYW
jgi:Bacterial Ig domain